MDWTLDDTGLDQDANGEKDGVDGQQIVAVAAAEFELAQWYDDERGAQANAQEEGQHVLKEA